ncbi:hypothetical protein [Kribbella sp. CA-293567]|uniref:hypothetical protein n=1 Tax=Kribbella sp. CA-293567 TaxID=3002436 RepID=UPI0022DE364B|nr:hypothetical protein [Kribbella sp. CA-293567]WBQ03823.1 hypothetical protein OX958_28115 [Kribbella sp. CA-293567]
MTLTQTKLDRDGVNVHVNPASPDAYRTNAIPADCVGVLGAGTGGLRVHEAFLDREDAVRIITALTDAVEAYDGREDAQSEAARKARELEAQQRNLRMVAAQKQADAAHALTFKAGDIVLIGDKPGTHRNGGYVRPSAAGRPGFVSGDMRRPGCVPVTYRSAEYGNHQYTEQIHVSSLTKAKAVPA